MGLTARIRTAIITFALVPAIATLAPHASHAASMIGPGAIIYSPVGQCTQNFVYKDGGGSFYVTTAGHCVNGAGDRVWFSGGTQFGTVVRRWYGGAQDFSLIKIDPAMYGEIDVAMRRWGGPTGVRSAVDSNRGDPVLMHGYGIGFGTVAQTRARAALLEYDDGDSWGAFGADSFGDSGGPLLDERTGQAIGFVNYFTLPLYTIGGATTEAFLAAASAAGYNLTLQTAPYTKPF